MTGNPILLFLVFWPMIGALTGYLIGRRNKNLRNLFADFTGILEFILCAVIFAMALNGAELECFLPDICVRGLSLKIDGFRAMYGLIAALMWMMTTIFSEEYLAHYRNRNRYYLFTLITFGATMGVFLSADLFTTFIFFEIMSFTSYVMVVHDEKEGAMRAGETYVAVAVIGGMVMLMGLFLLYDAIGTFEMSELLEACSAYPDKGRLFLAGILMLFGFGAKAGMYPLHIWLPKAHPVAPAPASALLSGILTKAGVFGILVITSNIFLHDVKWGGMILAIGVITMFLGAVIAVFSIDLKRTLACSSMSQIGFILTGVGMQCFLGEENALAVWGTELHMVNHSLIKLALFMAAGVVYMNLHKLDLNEIRGFGRNKPLLKGIFLMGYLGIIGMPLWNGYVSKTLLHESIVEYIELLVEEGHNAAIFHYVEWIFLISGGLTAAYMTKLFVAVFVEKNPYAQAKMEASDHKYMNKRSVFAIGGSALILPILGFFPNLLMDRLAALGQEFMHGEAPHHTIHYFSLTNLKGAVISLVIGAIVYFGFIRTCLMKNDENGNRIYVNMWPAWLDLENLLYRPLIAIAAFTGAFFMRVIGELTEWFMKLMFVTVLRSKPIKVVDPGELKEAKIINELEVNQTEKEIINSFSFALMLFAMGFIAVMVYILFVANGSLI